MIPTTFPLEAFGQSDEGSPGRQPMGGCRGLPVQEGDALQLDVDIIQALRAGKNDRRHYGAALTCLPFINMLAPAGAPSTDTKADNVTAG